MDTKLEWEVEVDVEGSVDMSTVVVRDTVVGDE
jgi:hypothetical protein